METIATLTALRAHLGFGSSDTSDDGHLLRALRAASVHVERAAGRRFTPRRAAVPHTISRLRSELVLSDDLLELTALTDAGGSVPLEAVIPLPEAPGPFSLLRLHAGRAFTWADSPLHAVTVSGVWGWHDDWPAAWTDSADTVLDDPLAASATTLNVGDADGANAGGDAPRFQAGHLLRLGDEYARVLAVDTALNRLTVERGANGTTAASHSAGTPIYVYRPPADVEDLTLRWAAWLYKSPDLRPQAGAPDSLLALLDSLRRVRV